MQKNDMPKLYPQCFLQASKSALLGNDNSILAEITAYRTAPILFSYVWWVLKTAQKSNITRLYFLARDGYILYQFAQKICMAYGLQIDCKYLYCSRIAWRMPSYQFIGDEADALIFSGGYKITPYILLNRIAASDQERKQIYQDIGFNPENEHQSMSETVYREFAQKVKKSPAFRKIVSEKSKSSYETTIGYLKQEGLLDGTPIAIVDTGWTGSMQRTLRQLLEHTGVTSQITGFYFGMYETPKSAQDGTYLTWYFSKQSNIFDIVKFNNNLLECMCIAPHPMTIGYKEKNGQFSPIFKDEKMSAVKISNFNIQYSVLDHFLDSVLSRTDFKTFTEPELRKITKALVQKFMYHPTKKEALAYAIHLFCDDAAESYMNPVVQTISQQEIKKYIFLRRLYNKAFHKGKEEPASLFWPYGSLAASEIKYKNWYRLNILLWDIIRYFYVYKHRRTK